MKPSYLGVIDQIISEHKAGKRKLELALEIESGLYGNGYSIIHNYDLERLKVLASEAERARARRVA